MLLNLLISKMGDTFAEVKDNEDNLLLKRRARFIDVCEAGRSAADGEGADKRSAADGEGADKRSAADGEGADERSAADGQGADERSAVDGEGTQ